MAMNILGALKMFLNVEQKLGYKKLPRLLAEPGETRSWLLLHFRILFFTCRHFFQDGSFFENLEISKKFRPNFFDCPHPMFPPT